MKRKVAVCGALAVGWFLACSPGDGAPEVNVQPGSMESPIVLPISDTGDGGSTPPNVPPWTHPDSGTHPIPIPHVDAGVPDAGPIVPPPSIDAGIPPPPQVDAGVPPGPGEADAGELDAGAPDAGPYGDPSQLCKDIGYLQAAEASCISGGGSQPYCQCKVHFWALHFDCADAGSPPDYSLLDPIALASTCPSP